MEEQALEEVKKEEHSLSNWIDSHPKTIFWTRLIAWAIFSAFLPFAFIFWRFDLFKTVSKTQIGGWELIGIILIAVFVFTVIRYIKIALSAKYSLLSQVLSGFCKIIIPLVAFLLILNSIKENVELMMKVIGCIIVCEAIAIPLNPLPKWAYEMQKNVRDSERKETFDYLLDGFFKRKKDNESGGK